MSIKPVDLEEFAPTASEILRSAWKPPCLDYSQEYLRWQFGFPSDLKPVALAGYHAGRPTGFVAATGRNTNAGPLYMSSFMSLLPGTPSSFAIGIIRHQSRVLRDSGLPTVVFAQTGSLGERLLEVGETVGLKRFPLGQYRIHGAVPRIQPADVAAVPVSSSRWFHVSDSLSDDNLLSLSFDDDTLRHLEADPFGREFLIVEKDKLVVGSAMLSKTRSISATGIRTVPTLHCIRLRNGDPDALSALLYYARSQGQFVNVPNVSHIPVETRKAAGLRATPSDFVAYILTAGAKPAFWGTDFEIV